MSRAVYNILALTRQGHKDLIGMYISESEGARFWLQVLTDLKNGGLEDILIACIDNLQGFAEAIRSTFPLTQVQRCVIHQIRNSLKYVASKDQKEFIKDLKPVYSAVNKLSAEDALLALVAKWEKKYPLWSTPGKTTGRNAPPILSTPSPSAASFTRPVPSRVSYIF